MSNERTYKKDLLGLDVNGRPCERCGEHMHEHDWVILDDNGFVITCSKIAIVGNV